LLPRNIKIKITRTVILPVMYGCETWSLTLREEFRLRVFESRVLRRIFEPKRDEVTGEWSLMICTLHPICSDGQIEKNEMGGACSTYGERRGIYRVLMGEPEGKNNS